MFSKRSITFCVVLAILLCLAWAGYRYLQRAPKTNEAPTASLLPFRTIPGPGHTTDLISYELHTRTGNYGGYTDCSAIIKLTDRRKGDYKSVCRLVISDIKQSIRSEKLLVTVFDDFQSYILSAIEYDQKFRVLNDAEADSVRMHKVAVYYGNMYEDENPRTLWYYPDDSGQYNEKEIFFP